jgi:hypothetical protein
MEVEETEGVSDGGNKYQKKKKKLKKFKFLEKFKIKFDFKFLGLSWTTLTFAPSGC